MTKIFKYELPLGSHFCINLPKDHKIIRVDQVDGKFWIWVIVNVDRPVQPQFFQCIPLPILEEFTLQLPRDSDIIHVDDFQGKFYMWIKYTNDIEHTPFFFECYKTGMPFKNPTMSLKYLGLCKLYVMQQLGLYIFLNLYKTNSALKFDWMPDKEVLNA